MKKRASKTNKILSIITGIVFTIISVICIAIIVFNFTHSYSQVVGNSMYPTLNSNQTNEDYVFVSKIKSYTYNDIIVANRQDGNQTKKIVKRVIALGGDKIKIELTGDKYQIKIIYYNETDETVLEENYLTETTDNSVLFVDFSIYMANTTLEIEDGYLVIPENYVFILGDNRAKNQSYDSADYGPLSCDAVVGKVDYIIYGGKLRYIQVLKQILGIK